MARRKWNPRVEYSNEPVTSSEPVTVPEYEPYKELEEVQEIISGYADLTPIEVPMEAALDDAKVEAYAFDLIADNIGISDIPIDYQQAVKERRLRILRGE